MTRIQYSGTGMPSAASFNPHAAGRRQHAVVAAQREDAAASRAGTANGGDGQQPTAVEAGEAFSLQPPEVRVALRGGGH